jgi:hypothetical protein
MAAALVNPHTLQCLYDRNLVPIPHERDTGEWDQASPSLNVDEFLASSTESISLIYNSPESFMEPYSQGNTVLPLQQIPGLAPNPVPLFDTSQTVTEML